MMNHVLLLLLIVVGFLGTSIQALDTCSSSQNVASASSCQPKNEPGIATSSVVPSRSMKFAANAEDDPAVNKIGQRAVDDSIKVSFTLHANGDGLGEGIPIDSKLYKQIDDVIAKYCCELANLDASRCAPASGARLITEVGVRMLSFNDVEEGQRVYCVPQGLHFVWPMKKTGFEFYPKNVKSPVEGKPIKMKQLSEQIRVFSVENFVQQEEIEEILEVNRNRMTPSEVGFGGWQDDTRTSSTSWDFDTKASIAIQKRTFEILGMDYDSALADTLQVLRYTADGHRGHGQWYKPHVDWFQSGGYDGHDPKVDNGTNRFATMFLYLSTVPKGGATVFPLSTTHEGYNGEKLVHDGTINTPGYIDTNEARYCCNETSTALRSKPIQGNAVLFYSQGPDGGLDPWSLHGGCPPGEGEKWSANVWVWNRPRPDKSAAKDIPKDVKKRRNPLAQTVVFYNKRNTDIELKWDSQAPVYVSSDLNAFTEEYRADLKSGGKRFYSQAVLPARNRGFTVNSYQTHVFIGVDKTDNSVVFVGQVKDPKEVPAEQFNGEALIFNIE